MVKRVLDPAFWRRRLSPGAKRVFVLCMATVLLVVIAVAGAWVHFQRTYERWLNNPPERLVGHSNVLIRDGEITEFPRGDGLERQMERHLVGWRSDHANIVELSRSDLLEFPLLGLAYTKVYLHTSPPNGETPGRRVEFVCEFVRHGGEWGWSKVDYNLALE